jgi:hypothetical protein
VLGYHLPFYLSFNRLQHFIPRIQLLVPHLSTFRPIQGFYHLLNRWYFERPIYSPTVTIIQNGFSNINPCLFFSISVSLINKRKHNNCTHWIIVRQCEHSFAASAESVAKNITKISFEALANVYQDGGNYHCNRICLINIKLRWE